MDDTNGDADEKLLGRIRMLNARHKAEHNLRMSELATKSSKHTCKVEACTVQVV